MNMISPKRGDEAGLKFCKQWLLKIYLCLARILMSKSFEILAGPKGHSLKGIRLLVEIKLH